MTKKNGDGNSEPTFEELLAEAESLAEKMEEGGMPLEESMRAYEKGVDNLKRCAALLRGAEEKVKTLIEKNGSFRLEDLGGDAEPDAYGYGEEIDEA